MVGAFCVELTKALEDGNTLPPSLSIHLLEWGVNLTIQSPDARRKHRQFAKDVIKTMLKAHDPQDSYEELLSNYDEDLRDLPADPNEAIENVLRDHLQRQVGLDTSYVDDLDHFPPYFVVDSKDIKGPDKARMARKYGLEEFNHRFCVVPKPKYRTNQFKRMHLDPFYRFEHAGIREDRVKYYGRRWRANGMQAGELLGFVYEALVASHINNNSSVSCRNPECMRKLTLKWCRGGRSWNDMQCSACQSAYEIKSLRDRQAIENAKNYMLNGGSYAGYFSCQESLRRSSPDAKHYIVAVDRKGEPLQDGGIRLCVHVAEIQGVLPRIVAESFAFGPNRFLKSKVQTKGQMKKWFEFNVQYDHRPIVEELLQEFCPDGSKTKNGNQESTDAPSAWDL